MQQNPYELFVNDANKDLTLTVNSQPGAQGARDIAVKPIGSEFNIRELDWIETNRRKVDAMTGGRVGYVYLRDMSGAGLNQFVEQFFPQIRKEGLIIDVRLQRRRLIGAQLEKHNHPRANVPGAASAESEATFRSSMVATSHGRSFRWANGLFLVRPRNRSDQSSLSSSRQTG